MKIKQIEWSDINTNHEVFEGDYIIDKYFTKGTTPLGHFYIYQEKKKDKEKYIIEETIISSTYFDNTTTLKEAKEMCQKEYESIVNKCLEEK